jgi:hypothetical protein
VPAFIEKGENMTNNSYQHGGKRAGSGAKPLGITRKVSVTLSQKDWDFIDECTEQSSDISSRSAFFRWLYLITYEPNSIRLQEFDRKRKN